jgi:5-methylcytosine-specific restriction enzyme subunit McrC
MVPVSASATIHLTERRARLVRLAPTDVAFLRAHHCTHLRLDWTDRPDHYCARPAGVVGVIRAPGCRLVIAPKIPVANLFAMLAADESIGTQADSSEVWPTTGIVDFLAGQLAQRLQERIGAGLHWAYVERSAAGGQLQGRLDLPAQLRQAAGRKDRLHSRRDETTVDLPCNRLPRALAERLLAWPDLDQQTAGRLREALGGLQDVRSAMWSLDEARRLAVDPPAEDYRSLLQLCLLVAEGLTPGLEAGPAPTPTFLLDLQRAFEGYLARGVAAAFSGSRWRVEVQRAQVVNDLVTGQPELMMRPDVVVWADDRPALVVDAKWKRLAGGLPQPDDLHQLLAYCTGLGVSRSALVYPGTRNRTWTWRLAAAPVTVQAHTLAVAASPQACWQALQRLGRHWRRQIDRSLEDG